MIWLYLSALAMVVTAVIHSVAGEKRIIGPLSQVDSPITRNQRSQKIFRSAWHLTSLFMVVFGAVVAWPGTPDGVIRLIGGVWLLIGLFSLISSRGTHVGWPSLSAAGIFAIVGTLP